MDIPHSMPGFIGYRRKNFRTISRGVAAWTGLPRRLALLCATAQSPIGQLILNRRRQKQASIAKALPNYGNRVNDIIQFCGEVEKNIGINGDELWPVYDRPHSRVSG